MADTNIEGEANQNEPNEIEEIKKIIQEEDTAKTDPCFGNLEIMLEFEKQIFLDLLEKDALVICAKGLNIDTVLINLLKAYNDPGNLILVLNSSDYEEQYLTEKLNSASVYNSNYQTNQALREEAYLCGGIHFVTTRILVVDLLKKRVPIEHITGIFVLRAHAILESCQEAFALRLYRQHNKVGFIKAFSNCAQSFTIGFGHVERVMRALFVKELYLWPRFHSLVVQTLKKYQPVVIELHVPMSRSMKEAQTCLLDLMNLTVKDLKLNNKTVELQEITVENCITKKFHKILQAQLDLIWYQLGSKTKQLVADLKTLRHLMVTMIHSDSVTFYSLVSQFMTQEHALNTTWVLNDSAERLFGLTKKMVYTGNKELDPELSPKWKALIEILKVDIPLDLQQLREKQVDIGKVVVLILCQDSKTCFQLNEVLSQSPQKFLFFMALKKRLPFSRLASTFTENIPVDDQFEDNVNATLIDQKVTELLKKYKPDENGTKKAKLDNSESDISQEELNAIFDDIGEDQKGDTNNDNYVLKMLSSQNSQALGQSLIQETPAKRKSLSQNLSITGSQNATQVQFETCTELENMDVTKIEDENPLVLIQTFKSNSDSLSLKKTLFKTQPNYIIMYQSDITAVRQIEIYEAKNQRKKPLKVYFLIHSETVEEQSYLTTLRREKEAFEFLVETKSKMVVPDYQDGKTEDCLTLQRVLANPLPDKNTRKAGGQDQSVEKATQKVIVDMREFRSELPALIHRRGIEVEPVTISIGDYILTPEICVERKSVSDLIQSLNSGRLYNQCIQMSRYYSKPMLLIEFDQNKPFQLQSNCVTLKDSSIFDIQQKLQLLTLHFPKLKLIWSPSPYASAQLFEEMKEGKEQPSSEYAASISNEEDLGIIEEKYNSLVYDFVQKLPGITSKNIDKFLRKTKNFDNVIKLSEEELAEILDNSQDAKLLFNIIQNCHKQEATGVEAANSKGAGKSRIRKKFGNVKK